MVFPFPFNWPSNLRPDAGADLVMVMQVADEAVKRRCRQLQSNYVEKSPRSWEQLKTLVESQESAR